MFNQIQTDLKDAMKSGNIEAREALRLLISEIQKEIFDSATEKQEPTDDMVMKAVEKSVKSRKEAIAIFEQQDRADLAEPEKKQLEVIMKYMPAQLSDEELKTIVDQVKSENPSVQGMALMGKIMPLVKGKADPDRIKSYL